MGLNQHVLKTLISGLSAARVVNVCKHFMVCHKCVCVEMLYLVYHVQCHMFECLRFSHQNV